MAGERNLATLLRCMSPRWNPGTYAFCVWPTEIAPPEAIGFVREAEGLTVVVEESIAINAGVPIQFRAAWLTLDVHSDLSAVGFLAEVAGALASAGLSCNTLSGVFHDHVFVPADRGAEALGVLRELAARKVCTG